MQFKKVITASCYEKNITTLSEENVKLNIKIIFVHNNMDVLYSIKL